MHILQFSYLDLHKRDVWETPIYFLKVCIDKERRRRKTNEIRKKKKLEKREKMILPVLSIDAQGGWGGGKVRKTVDFLTNQITH